MTNPQATVDLPADDLEAVKCRFLDAQLAGDRRRAVALISTAAAQPANTASDVRARVIRAAQAEIGRLWETNRISIAQEHMATAISHIALAALYDRERPRSANNCVVVVACVSGELHEFPARLVADEMELAGFDVRFLGANVPTDDLEAFVRRERPHLVVLSAALAHRADNVRDAVQAVRRAVGPNLPIAIGGQICEWMPRLGADLGVAICGGDASQLVDSALSLLVSGR